MSAPYGHRPVPSRSGLLARVPVRVRVALAFTAVMAVLLTATGLWLYARLGSTLDATVDRTLRQRAADVTALIRSDDAGLSETGRSPLTERGESLAQIVDPEGTIVDAPPALRDKPLLSSREVRRATRDTIVVEHTRTPLQDDRVRLLATPVDVRGRRIVVIVGASIEPGEEAQHEFGGLLLIGGPVALLLASAAGYAAAAGALRPVELMRRRAREVRAGQPGMRLPVPPSNDEVARLGETLNEMLARLEEAFARERAFVADASHELRTPLAILKGELELALRDASDAEAFREAVTSAAEETDRLVQLAEDLLIIARSDQGELAIRRARVDTAELLERVRERFARRATEHGVALDVAPTSSLVLDADGLRLEQALGNLVDNALRHGDGHVRLSATQGEHGVELHVRDDGPGFPEPFVAHAFERFSRADVARGRGGAGLGLAIVEAIAHAHGGEGRVANRPEGGADVWLTVPATAAVR
jgi:two-component system, OmpR family, sensor kinase